MDANDPTSVIKMIKDLQSNTGNYHHRSSGVSLRLSGTGIPMTLIDNDNQSENTPLKRKRLDESNFGSQSSLMVTGSDSVPGSPWEWRRLKGEVVSLRTRLSHQEANAQQLHTIRRQMEDMFEKEKSSLEMQAELDKQTIKQLEARIDVSRRNLQEALHAQTQAEKNLSTMRSKLEHKIVSLVNENARLIESQRLTTTQNANAVLPLSKDSDEELTELRIKYEAAEVRIAELEHNLKENLVMQRETELRCVELQNAKIRIERLESERALCEEGKLLSSRAARASDLEKELQSTRETLAAMRESVKGKLLLEEEIFNIRQRMEHMGKLEEQVVHLEASRAELLRKLSEYELIGFGVEASTLRRELNRLQQSEAIHTAEEGQLRSKIAAIQRENQTLTIKYDEAKRIATEMTTSTERLNRLVSRLQKKIILISRERDSYKQQLDLYEKENTGNDGNNAGAERIPALERDLEAYRDLVSKLEVDLNEANSGVTKDECQKLRKEVDRLQGELEHRALKGDFNCNAKILHFTMNPAAIAAQRAEEKQQSLLREVEELRAQVQVGSSASIFGSSVHAQEVAELKQTHEIKIARLKDAFKISSQEYRQACYQLFGWRVDRSQEGKYKLFSQYAGAPDDFLYFHVGDEGVDLLETPFSATLGTLIQRHLQMQHSVPMFINAVQSDLFSQQTVTSVVS